MDEVIVFVSRATVLTTLCAAELAKEAAKTAALVAFFTVSPFLIAGSAVGVATFADSVTGKGTCKKKLSQVGGGLVLVSGGFLVSRAIFKKYRPHANDLNIKLAFLLYSGIAGGSTAVLFAGAVPWAHGRFIEAIRRQYNNPALLTTCPKPSHGLEISPDSPNL